MVLAFVGNDFRDNRRRVRIHVMENFQLLIEVIEHDGLDGFRRQSDGACARKSSHKPQRKAAQPA